MKSLILLLTLSPIFGLGQKDTLSEVDKFYSLATGAMIKKEFTEVGKTKHGNVTMHKLDPEAPYH